MERNQAAPKHVAWPSCAWVHLSFFPFSVGHPMSAGCIWCPQLVGGGGSPKSKRKEQNQLICDSDKGEGGQKIRKCCGRHIWKPPWRKFGFFPRGHRTTKRRERIIKECSAALALCTIVDNWTALLDFRFFLAQIEFPALGEILSPNPLALPLPVPSHIHDLCSRSSNRVIAERSERAASYNIIYLPVYLSVAFPHLWEVLCN